VDVLTWTEIAERLSGARNYWLHTTGPARAPNATPVWGVVLREVLYHYSQSGTVKARNLAHDRRVVVHLESASDVVIVHGSLNDLGPPASHPDVVQAFEEKYDRPEEVPFLPSSEPAFDVLYALEPRRAVTWSLPDTEASTRRWSARNERSGTI
jgi:hypothetical protein